MWGEHEIRGSRGFTRADIRQALDWYRAGKIVVDHLTQVRLPLLEINSAIDNLSRPDVLRSVIVFGA